jgi:hypothetical protein
MGTLPKNALKFPYLNNVEYFDLIKHKKTLKTFLGKDINGLSWRDLQKKAGLFTGETVCNYSLKFENDNTVNRGTIRIISSLPAPSDDKNNNQSVLNEIENLKSKISSAAQSSGISVDLLLSISKQSYESQINFLNAEIIKKDNIITKLENKIDSYEDELNNCYEVIDDLKAKTGVNQYLELAQTFLQSKIGTAKKITTLKDSAPQDIPEKILLILGAVDWTQVPGETLAQIINYLEIFITKLPLKGV